MNSEDMIKRGLEILTSSVPVMDSSDFDSVVETIRQSVTTGCRGASEYGRVLSNPDEFGTTFASGFARLLLERNSNVLSYEYKVRLYTSVRKEDTTFEYNFIDTVNLYGLQVPFLCVQNMNWHFYDFVEADKGAPCVKMCIRDIKWDSYTGIDGKLYKVVTLSLLGIPMEQDPAAFFSDFIGEMLDEDSAIKMGQVLDSSGGKVLGVYGAPVDWANPYDKSPLSMRHSCVYAEAMRSTETTREWFTSQARHEGFYWAPSVGETVALEYLSGQQNTAKFN